MRRYPVHKFNLWISCIHFCVSRPSANKTQPYLYRADKETDKASHCWRESNSAEIMLELPAHSDNTDPFWRLSLNCWIPEESVWFCGAGWWEERGTFLHSQFVTPSHKKSDSNYLSGGQLWCLPQPKNILERVFNYYFNKLPNHPYHKQPILKSRITEWFGLEGH